MKALSVSLLVANAGAVKHRFRQEGVFRDINGVNLVSNDAIDAFNNGAQKSEQQANQEAIETMKAEPTILQIGSDNQPINTIQKDAQTMAEMETEARLAEQAVQKQREIDVQRREREERSPMAVFQK